MAEMENAGGIEVQLRLELSQMQKDALEAQKKIDELAAELKAKGKEAGDGFSRGFNSGKTKYDASLNTMKANLASLGPWGQKAGTTLANGLSKPVIAAVPKMALAFRSLQAAMGPVMIVIGLVTSAIMAVKHFVEKQGEAAEEAKRKQEELNAVIKNTRDAYSSVADIISRGVGGSIRDTQTNLGEMSRAFFAARDNMEAFKAGLDRMAESSSYSSRAVLLQENEELAAQYNRLNNMLGIASDRYNNAIRRFQEVRAMTAGMTEEQGNAYDEIIGGLDLAERTIAEALRRNAITEKEANEQRISAIDNYINKANEFATREKLDVALINNGIREQIELRNSLRQVRDTSSDQEKITAARKDALEKYAQAEQKARDARTAGLIDEKEMEKQISAAQAQKYSDLEAIVTQYKLTTGETVRLRDETAALVKDTQDLKWLEETQAALAAETTSQKIAQLRAQAVAAKSEREKNDLLDEALGLEIDILKKKREQERLALENSESFKAQSEDVKRKLLKDFDEITDGMIENLGKASSAPQKLGDVFKEHGEQILSSSLGVMNEIAEASTAAIEREVEKQTKILDKKYKEDKERLDKELQDKLYQLGYIEAATAEQHERELELAIESGDQQRIYAAHSAKVKFDIEEEYAQKQKELEEQLEMDKAKLQYKAEMAGWQAKKLSAAASAAMAIINAITTQPFPVGVALAAVATAMGIAQMAAIEQAKPVLQFSGGGIVPGSSYTGDRLTAGVNSKEMILNMDQQRNLFDAVNSNSIGEGQKVYNIITAVNLDGREICRNTVTYINNGAELIKQRSVVK